MEQQLKPVKVPNELAKRHMFLWMFSVVTIWAAIAIVIAMVSMSDRMLVVLVGFWMFTFLMVLMLPVLCDKVFFLEGVQVRLLGKVIRQIPLSEFKFLCAVGDDVSQYLCLSLWDLE